MEGTPKLPETARDAELVAAAETLEGHIAQPYSADALRLVRRIIAASAADAQTDEVREHAARILARLDERIGEAQ